MVVLPTLILILLIFIGVPLFAIWLRRLSRSNPNRKRIVKIVVGLYFSILIAAPLVYGLLPNKPSHIVFVKEKEANERTVQLRNALFHGRTDTIEADFIKNQWKFEYDGSKLQIAPTEGFFEGEIVIERKTEADGMIEATYYMSTILAQVDVTKDLIVPNIKLNKDRLEIASNPGTIEISYSFMKKEFPISQFTGENLFASYFSEPRQSVDILYLRIPKNVDVINDQYLAISYIGH
ncbi:hypothetical protein [Bacillus sp. FJAT-50079]|uniref:hypothetical protein n=1 Tax=Bacillus sp. FJAT-50079 TaxID=2833577 RepID=UPI001BC97E36|nr:hypothetical protein [Bacillus sp. FJAT-50079]MBS4210145.1 hypothetical protein [Bacillus sp. FJAT-50079]